MKDDKKALYIKTTKISKPGENARYKIESLMSVSEDDDIRVEEWVTEIIPSPENQAVPY